MTLNAQPLWDWITERHRIYLKKAAGEPPPWTQDEIMQTHRFCNVFRELDKVHRRGPRELEGPYALEHTIADRRTEGVINDVRDLRQYLTLVEPEMAARGAIQIGTARDNREGT